MTYSYSYLKNYTDKHILDFMPAVDPKSNTLYEAMKYSLLAGGKRLRPVLLLASYALCAGDKANLNTALPFACAAEYIQTYSLIHDDLPAMDNDDLRRGLPTNHKVFGENMAILAGDGLLSAAYEVMSKNMLMYLDNPEAMARMARAQFALVKGTGVRGMVAGQVCDVENEGKSCSQEMLDFIHINKTAAFINGCVLCGAYLGGADKDQLQNLNTYGENLGLAFQVIDDILDVTSTPEKLGKSVGQDAKTDKSTYPAIFGIEASKIKAVSLLVKAKEAAAPYFEFASVHNEVIANLEKQLF